jgi:Uma2 family endonuclease
MVATKLVTAQELEAMGPGAERLELINGEVHEVPAAGGGHGILGGRLIRYISSFAASAGLGEVLNAETGFIVGRNPDSVLMPDASFVAAARLPEGGFWEGFVPFAPDFAVEIESPTNTQSELLRKVTLYLDGGTQLVWLVRPKQRTVTVFRPDVPEQILGEDDALDGGNVLPGFSLPLADLFRPHAK